VSSPARRIVVYRVERHPLDVHDGAPSFAWLGSVDGTRKVLEGLIGPFDPGDVTFLVDESPSGPAWQELLEALLEERLRMVITHLAPLSPAQRQQLIGICAETGTQLITPGDAGRNPNLSLDPKTRPLPRE
jgi:hypothetical protein